MIGAGLAGPRRIKAGGARDHLLGAHAVSGFGDSFKAGGRVVKNVTGYDLCKLLAGSWGTLAVMTEVTLKVMPRPESERTLVLRGLDDVAANKAMTAALGSPFDVSAAAHVPNSALRGSVAGLGETWRSRIAARGGHAVAAGGHYGVRRASRRRACQGSCAVWGRRDRRGRRLGGDLEFDSRRPTVRGQRRARRVAGVADRLSAGFRRRARSGAGARYRRRGDLRLGRRPDLGGAAPQARRPGGAGARARRCRSAVTPRCCARPTRCGAMSMCFIPSTAVSPHLANVFGSASIRKPSSIAAG